MKSITKNIARNKNPCSIYYGTWVFLKRKEIMGGIGKCIKVLLGISIFSLASMKGLSLISEHSADWVAKYEKNADLETAKAVTEDTVEVSDHQSFLDAVYLMALNRQLSGTFYYKGDYNDIFHGDINKLLSEICAIDDKETSDDADYLENSISSINVGTSYNYIGSKIIDSTITIKIKYLESAQQLKEVNKKVKKILKKLDLEGKSEAQKVKLIHDYIINNTKYISSENSHTAYGALQGKAVCQGYSQLAYKMLTDANIKCHFISGKANNGKKTEDHAWNLVQVKNKWYYLDVTWDDPTGGEDRLRYDYFLVGSKRFEKDHMAAKEFKKLITKASKSDYKE